MVSHSRGTLGGLEAKLRMPPSTLSLMPLLSHLGVQAYSPGYHSRLSVLRTNFLLMIFCLSQFWGLEWWEVHSSFPLVAESPLLCISVLMLTPLGYSYLFTFIHGRPWNPDEFQLCCFSRSFCLYWVLYWHRISLIISLNTQQASYLQTNLGSITILILSLWIHEHGISFHLFRFNSFKKTW